jgi:cytochrome c biogenesis protein CcmG/thiol:disulfide interchange protein DsbE
MKIIPWLFFWSLFLFAQEHKAIAPDFASVDINGDSVYLDSLIAQGPVFMTFWSLRCKMCIKELNVLKAYYNELDSLGVSLLAVSEDKARSHAKIKPFVMSNKWKYKIVLDPENVVRDLYQVQAMPTSFIINRNKKIVYTHQGYKPGDENVIFDKLREILQENTNDEPEE